MVVFSNVIKGRNVEIKKKRNKDDNPEVPYDYEVYYNGRYQFREMSYDRAADALNLELNAV